jgi:hypothetical protein
MILVDILTREEGINITSGAVVPAENHKGRAGVQVTNRSTTDKLYVKLSKVGENPSIDATDFDFMIPPETTLTLEATASVEVTLFGAGAYVLTEVAARGLGD